METFPVTDDVPDEDIETDGDSDAVPDGEDEGGDETDGDAVAAGLELVEADGDIDSDPDTVAVPDAVVDVDPEAGADGDELTETLGEEVIEGEKSGDALKTALSDIVTLPDCRIDVDSFAVDDSDIRGENESLDDPVAVNDALGENEGALLLESFVETVDSCEVVGEIELTTVKDGDTEDVRVADSQTVADTIGVSDAKSGVDVARPVADCRKDSD